MPTTEQVAREYKLLKQTKRLVEKRLGELRNRLIAKEFVNPGVLKECSLELQVRDLTTFNENKVWELMDSKGIHHHYFTRKVIEPSLVEQLYLEGTLNDDDLRYIREPKYSHALIEKEVDENVQGLNDRDDSGDRAGTLHNK